LSGKLEGKVAFITGIARGQGRSHAIRLAEEGADIIGIDICESIEGVPYPGATPEDLAETIRAVEALGRRILATQADVREYAQVEAAVNAGVAEFGRLDIVSANAGIAAPGESTSALSLWDWNNMININLTGVWHTTKACVPHIIAGGRGGSIVLTSSVAGLMAYGNIGHYVASKHGVVGLMRTLAVELGPHSIRVNSLHPTQVDTEMIMNDATYRLFEPDSPTPSREGFAPISQALHTLPIPWVDSIDVSNALLFLVSDDSRYITGVTLPIDAGVLVKKT
jgi:(+)-trans-carveol dehydrogenase